MPRALAAADEHTPVGFDPCMSRYFPTLFLRYANPEDGWEATSTQQ
jgi:hypothetical protein